MKKLLSLALATTLFAASSPHIHAQSAAERSKALNALFAEMWEDHLQHSPEFASSIGDKRWNDQLSDRSGCCLQ